MFAKLLRSGRDLTAYSDRQLANGFSYIFYNYASNVIYAICQKGVAAEKRVDAVRNISALYRDCLTPRCAPVLSHLDEPGATSLNAFCYVLWDESPLCQWKGVVLDVMEEALYLFNPACVESALHGLSRRFHQSPSEVAKIVDRFLTRGPAMRPELRSYALMASRGRAQ